MIKKWLASILFILLAAGFSAAPGQTIPESGLKSITPAEMKSHVYYLASAAMNGRDTPSPELDTCAAYIAGEFKSYGLEPVNGSYYQRFNLLRTKLGSANSLSMSTGSSETPFEIKKDFVPLHISATRKVEAPLVFAGYGITAPEYGYDDYADMDVKGKIVIVFSGEPQEKDSTSCFDGLRRTDHSRLIFKAENAMDRGAVGILLVQNPSKRFRRPPNPWPSLMRNASPDAVPLTLEERSDKKIVAMQLGKNCAEALLDGSGKSMETIFDHIDKTLTPASFEIPGKTITMETTLAGDKFPTQNVVGYLEGSDPDLKHELVVIGAHYDHVGARNNEVYNGADDNASGTSGVMEVAEAFSDSKMKPKRSLLFMAFAGEEKGLFGSRFYTDNPLYPIDRTVAMLNMDMISRNDSSEIAVVGAKCSDDLKRINEECNEKIGLKLLYDSEQFFMNSDHYSFYRKQIPSLFYFSKVTPDLHRPTDDPEKIIPEKMATVGRLVFSTAWVVANRAERPDFIKFR